MITLLHSYHLQSLLLGKLQRSVTGHNEKVTSIVSMTDQIFWSASGDKKIKKWAADTGNVLCVYMGHTAAINKIVLLKDKIVSAGDDGTIRIWSRRDMEDRIRWYSGSSADMNVNRGLTSDINWYASGKKDSKSKGKDEVKAVKAAKKEQDDLSWYM